MMIENHFLVSFVVATMKQKYLMFKYIDESI